MCSRSYHINRKGQWSGQRYGSHGTQFVGSGKNNVTIIIRLTTNAPQRRSVYGQRRDSDQLILEFFFCINNLNPRRYSEPLLF